MNTELAVYVTSLVSCNLHIRGRTVYSYTTDTVRAGIYRVECYLYGTTSLIYQYEVGVRVNESCLSVTEHHLVGFQYELVGFQCGYSVIIRYCVGYLFFSFQAGAFSVSLSLTVCAAVSPCLMRTVSSSTIPRPTVVASMRMVASPMSSPSETV